MWINFAKSNPNLKIEIRTKSANFNSIKNISPCNNVILAWTLSPEKVSMIYENKTPPLIDRLINARDAIDCGWNVRLCFDPVLYLNDWEKNYTHLVYKTFSIIPPDKILDVSVGVFRVSSQYLKIMRKQRFDSVILNYPFVTKNKNSSYDKKLSDKMIIFVKNLISKYISDDKIFI